jgi:hypothetical protein
MSYDDDGQLAFELVEQLLDLLRCDRVESTRWLVEKKELRTIC